MSYPLIAEVDDVGLLSAPFLDVLPESLLLDRIWLGRDDLSRWRALNRYTGEEEYLTAPTGFGDGDFGDGLFGWS